MQDIFPNGARGAFSLTYDDGSADHLDAAMPDLESRGLRGTFYIPTRLTGGWSCFTTRREDWRAAAGRGHEIGNHTQYHPCAAGPAWVKPNFSLEAYGLARMEAELLAAGRDLDEVCVPVGARSFAYPCCQSHLGPERTSYRPLAGRLFPACRGGPDRILVDPMDCEYAFLPGWVIRTNTPLAEILSFIDEAIEHRRWGVLVFHNVGTPSPITTPRPTHQAILDYVNRRSGELWCAPFLEVVLRLREVTRMPWS